MKEYENPPRKRGGFLFVRLPAPQIADKLRLPNSEILDSMSLGFLIQRVDGQPLGSADEVKAELRQIFSVLKFVLVQPLGSESLAGQNIIVRFVFWLGRRKGPYWSGLFQDATFAIELTFDDGPVVRKINGTLYGVGSPGAEPYLSRLSERTGWQIKYPRW